MEPISFSCQRSKGTSVSCSCRRSAKEAEAATEETEGGGSKVEAAEERVLFWIIDFPWVLKKQKSPKSPIKGEGAATMPMFTMSMVAITVMAMAVYPAITMVSQMFMLMEPVCTMRGR